MELPSGVTESPKNEIGVVITVAEDVPRNVVYLGLDG